MAKAFDIVSIVRFHIRDAQVFDHSNDTVVVTRTLLRKAAAEIDRLRGALRHLLIQLDGVPVKHPQQGEQRAAAREMLNIQQPIGEA